MNKQTFIDHLVFQYSTSQGKGGQNVNKRETKAQWFFNIQETNLLNERQKQKLKIKYRQYINQDGNTLLISNQEFRTQKANKEAVINRFLDIIEDVFKIDKIRQSTKIPRSQIFKRQTDKQSQSKVKQQRQGKIKIEIE